LVVKIIGAKAYQRGRSSLSRELKGAAEAIEGMDDAAAITRSLKDPQAFVAVFDRHYTAVHGFAGRRAGPDLADEIAAETFTRAFDRRTTYDRSYPDARPWLLAIASNLLRRHWKAERRHLEAWAKAQAGTPRHEALPDGVASELIDALDALAPADREALLLYAWGELSYEEIASAMNTPVGTVRSRIARARGRLSACLEDSHA
jgi:RNA polymerase sigma-70 factor (ECF subfamily)